MTPERAAYIRWLRAAYLYYVDPNGRYTGMHDLEWDHWSRVFLATRDQYPKDEYPVLHDPRFTGGSIFWLKADEYPQEAK